MKCPECGSTHINKNGIKRGKQNHFCVDCGRQFINPQSSNPRGYSDLTLIPNSKKIATVREIITNRRAPLK